MTLGGWPTPQLSVSDLPSITLLGALMCIKINQQFAGIF
jgi:hypothetical protein